MILPLPKISFVVEPPVKVTSVFAALVITPLRLFALEIIVPLFATSATKSLLFCNVALLTTLS